MIIILPHFSQKLSIVQKELNLSLGRIAPMPGWVFSEYNLGKSITTTNFHSLYDQWHTQWLSPTSYNFKDVFVSMVNVLKLQAYLCIVQNHFCIHDYSHKWSFHSGLCITWSQHHKDWVQWDTHWCPHNCVHLQCSRTCRCNCRNHPCFHSQR